MPYSFSPWSLDMVRKAFGPSNLILLMLILAVWLHFATSICNGSKKGEPLACSSDAPSRIDCSNPPLAMPPILALCGWAVDWMHMPRRSSAALPLLVVLGDVNKLMVVAYCNLQLILDVLLLYSEFRGIQSQRDYGEKLKRREKTHP